MAEASLTLYIKTLMTETHVICGVFLAVFMNVMLPVMCGCFHGDVQVSRHTFNSSLTGNHSVETVCLLVMYRMIPWKITHCTDSQFVCKQNDPATIQGPQVFDLNIK